MLNGNILVCKVNVYIIIWIASIGRFFKQDAILEFELDLQLWIMDTDSLKNEKKVHSKWLKLNFSNEPPLIMAG